MNSSFVRLFATDVMTSCSTEINRILIEDKSKLDEAVNQWLKLHPYKPRTFVQWLINKPFIANTQNDAIKAIDMHVSFCVCDYHNEYDIRIDRLNQLGVLSSMAKRSNEAYGSIGVYVSKDDFELMGLA